MTVTSGLAGFAAEPPLDPSREQAHDLLERELSDPVYRTGSGLLSRVWEWFTGSFDSGGPGPGLPAAGLVIVVLLALAVGAVIVLRTVRVERTGPPRTSAGVFGPIVLPAADHRRRAVSARDAGDWDGALVESFRAMTADAAERAVLDLTPGLTAQEVERSLATAFPSETDHVEWAAAAFDRVRYGGEHVGEDEAEAAITLDGRLHRAPVATFTGPEVTGR